MASINIISATRLSEADFWQDSLLGRSLASFTAYSFNRHIAFDNCAGLPAWYNRAITRVPSDEDILVFAHDDVLIADFYWIDHLLNGLQRFDIVGVAGTTRRVPQQAKWFYEVTTPITRAKKRC